MFYRITPDQQLKDVIAKKSAECGLKPATYIRSLLIQHFIKTGDYKPKPEKNSRI